MTRLVRTLGAVAATVVFAGRAAAQEPMPIPSLTQMPGSTRAHALGHSYALSSAESDAIFFHPGLLDAARGVAGSIVREGPSTLVSLSAAGDWFRGGLGFAVQATTSNVLSEQVASLAYARSRFGLRIGAVGKVINTRLGDTHNQFFAGDLGVARGIGPVTAGLTARNLGADPDVEGQDTELATTVTLGASLRQFELGPLDVLPAASAKWLRNGDIAAGAGAEVSYYPVTGRTFAARVGFSTVEDSPMKALTLGAGFTGDRIAIDYAFQDTKNGENPIHRVSLRWR